ncbi:MAG: hypothetical protein COA57_08530 [Flavobacteriales bacterium]|nr:MAG: hypothetical protein COA57_08530 [Flavobacteriales bacterium]
MQSKTIFLYRLFFLALLMVTAVTICEAAPAPPTTGGDPTCWPPPCVPIDGGIGLLLAAGVFFGGKKMHDSVKGQKTR